MSLDTPAWLHKQGKEPLFKDLLWDKPETKLQAGKLLIIGGNLHSFAAPANAYVASEQAGIGTAKVLLPKALQKVVGQIVENGEFAPSNKSGSFAKTALAEWLSLASWSDGILLAGDFGRNSETAIIIERFIERCAQHITITQDGLDYFTADPEKLLQSRATCVTSFAQLQKLAMNSRFTTAFTYNMTVNQMTEALHMFTSIHPATMVLLHNGVFYVAKDGDVSTTKDTKDEPMWRIKTAATLSVWELQHPTKAFAALTTGIFELTS
jgi:hypothetical protein